MSKPFISLNLSANFGVVSEQMFSRIENQIGYAAKLTVNDLAFDIKRDVDAEMRSTFHKPTPFTMSAIRVIRDEESARETVSSGGIPMRVNRKQFSAYVGLAQQGMPASSKKSRTRVTADDAWERALKHQFTGGMRRYTRWEAALHKKGLIPSGHYAVPASGCPLDSYDNPVPGFMVQLLSYFSAFDDVGKGYRANMNAKGKARFEKKLEAKMGGALKTQFFISKGKSGADPGFVTKSRGYNSVPAGIWQRYYGGIWGGYGIRPIFLFYPATSYRQLIPFASIAASTFRSKVAERYAKNLRFAIRTAKR